jgi:fucose permease
MNAFQSITAVTLSGAFVVGMLFVLLESLRALLAKRLNLSEGRADWLLSAFNLTLIPMMLVSGILSDHVGVKSVFLVGSLATVVGVAALAMSDTGLKALGAILLSGVGGAGLSTGSSLLMSKAFFPDNELASQNLGNVFFGLGAFVTPALVVTLLRRLDFRRAIGVVALLCLLPALIAAVTEQKEFLTQDRPAALGPILQSPLLWLAGFAFLFYAPLEGSIGTWATQYLVDRGLRERMAAWLLAGFWLMFLASRLVTALLLEHGTLPHGAAAAWFLIALALAAAVFLGNLAGAQTRMGAALGLLAVGAIYGPIFPTLVGILFLHFPHTRGTAFGAMFAIGAVANLFVPPFIGVYARRTTVQRAMVIPMILALLLALATLVLSLFPLFRQG